MAKEISGFLLADITTTTALDDMVKARQVNHLFVLLFESLPGTSTSYPAPQPINRSAIIDLMILPTTRVMPIKHPLAIGFIAALCIRTYRQVTYHRLYNVYLLDSWTCLLMIPLSIFSPDPTLKVSFENKIVGYWPNTTHAQRVRARRVISSIEREIAKG